jgi:sodium/pantothenate symporter
MSTVSSLLIASSSAIVKDLYLSRLARRAGARAPSDKFTRRAAIVITFALGLGCLAIAFRPPSLIVWINLFAFGGLQSAFFWVFVLGLFWKRANAPGAFCGMTGGVIVYCVLLAFGAAPGGLHQIVAGIAASLVLFVAGSFAGGPPGDRVREVFFPNVNGMSRESKIRKS